MDRRTLLAATAVAGLLLSGCAASAAGSNADPAPSHAMPDGTEMSGSEHDEHASEVPDGPAAAAQMVCAGSVVTAITKILGLGAKPTPTATWDQPEYSCTYDVGNGPLVLSVHDATDMADGEAHFTALRDSLPNAEDIPGLLGLGLPSFSTGEGIVAFLRDGKTLVVDATALPSGLGPDGTRTQDQVAYAVASAVLTCWVDHS